MKDVFSIKIKNSEEAYLMEKKLLLLFKIMLLWLLWIIQLHYFQDFSRKLKKKNNKSCEKHAFCPSSKAWPFGFLISR